MKTAVFAPAWVSPYVTFGLKRVGGAGARGKGVVVEEGGKR